MFSTLRTTARPTSHLRLQTAMAPRVLNRVNQNSLHDLTEATHLTWLDSLPVCAPIGDRRLFSPPTFDKIATSLRLVPDRHSSDEQFWSTRPTPTGKLAVQVPEPRSGDSNLRLLSPLRGSGLIVVLICGLTPAATRCHRYAVKKIVHGVSFLHERQKGVRTRFWARFKTSPDTFSIC
jgi:hypothetical protein